MKATIEAAPRLKLTVAQLGKLWTQLGFDYQDLADFTEAEAAYNHALGLFEHDPASQQNYALTLSGLGTLYGITGRFDAEENCHRRALTILERLGNTLEVAREQARLADAYVGMGKYKQAERYSAQALHTLASQPDASEKDKASMLVISAYAACFTGHCAEGIHRAQEAMSILRAAPAPDFLLIGHTHMALGTLEQRTGDRVHAEEDLREGLRVLRLNFPPSHPLVTDALAKYHNFLVANHRDAEAKSLDGVAPAKECTNCTVSVRGLRR